MNVGWGGEKFCCCVALRCVQSKAIHIGKLSSYGKAVIETDRSRLLRSNDNDSDADDGAEVALGTIFLQNGSCGGVLSVHSSNECHFACVTDVRYLSRVNCSVIYQTTLPTKGLFTCVTDVRFQPEVGPLVRRQMVLLTE